MHCEEAGVLEYEVRCTDQFSSKEKGYVLCLFVRTIPARTSTKGGFAVSHIHLLYTSTNYSFQILQLSRPKFVRFSEADDA